MHSKHHTYYTHHTYNHTYSHTHHHTCAHITPHTHTHMHHTLYTHMPHIHRTHTQIHHTSPHITHTQISQYTLSWASRRHREGCWLSSKVDKFPSCLALLHKATPHYRPLLAHVRVSHLWHFQGMATQLALKVPKHSKHFSSEVPKHSTQPLAHKKISSVNGCKWMRDHQMKNDRT